MASRGIRLTKPERAFITRAIGVTMSATEEKLRSSILDKFALSELPVRKGGAITVNDVIAAFREVLGSRLLAPDNAAVGVLAQMKNRIGALGLTRESCLAVARAAAEWKGVIRAESLVRQEDVLLAKSRGQLESVGVRTPQSSSPVELDDDEI